MTYIADWLRQSLLPRLEARMLLQKITGFNHAQLLAHDDRELSVQELGLLEKWQQVRLGGTPMAYIVGQREFYGRAFSVNPEVLIPRPETEHLVDAVLERLPETQPARLWDMGTGSGIIATTLKLERPLLQVFASDISASALRVAQANAQALGAEVLFSCGSWYDAFDEQTKKIPFDFIVSNPPYINIQDHHLTEGDVRFEPLSALTDFAGGLNAIAILCRQAPQYLKAGGYLIMEHGYDQQSPVQALLAENGFVQIETIKDLADLPRISLGRWCPETE